MHKVSGLLFVATIIYHVSSVMLGIAPYLTALFILPATMLHEASHALAAIMTGMHIQGWTLWPVVEAHSVILGSVTVIADERASFIIGVAPIIGGLFAVNVLFYKPTLMRFFTASYFLAFSVPSSDDFISAFSSAGIYPINAAFWNVVIFCIALHTYISLTEPQKPSHK